MSRFERNQRNQFKSWVIVGDGTRVPRRGPFFHGGTVDGTEAEDLWNLLCLLFFNAPWLFSRPPYKQQIYRLDGGSFTKIYCYICNGDAAIIRRSAEYIRSSINYPFALLCYDFDVVTNKYKKIPIFLHTPDGELYKHNGEDFELIPFYPSEAPLERTVLESPKASLWPVKLPSEVTDQECIFPPSTEGVTKMANVNGGKWMMYTSRNNMARHDDMFLAMVSLFQKGIFVSLKTATAMPNEGEKHQMSQEFGFDREGVLIFCYTADSEDKEDVLRAAKAIRRVIENDCIIYYKTNSASLEGNYLHEGKRHISKYMYTVGGGFYERDYLNRFKLLVPSTN